MDDALTFGRLLKRYRRAAHRTQEELAERAGYSAHYVSMLERGVRLPPPFTVDVLVDALALPETERAALHTAATPRPRAATPMQGVSLPAVPLIGREHDLARIVRLLEDDNVRLLTLTGPGGVGKTALARQVVATLAPAVPDGTAFVDLAVVSAPDDILQAIARALALRQQRAQPVHERLIAYLRERRMLLLLDSCERVAAGSAAVGDLLARCPRLTLVVTSRVPLRLQAEREFRVHPLALPDPGDGCPRSADDLRRSPAVALFVRRALWVKTDLTLDDEKLPVVADICRRVDGLPLAIELAAARISHLPLTALHDRLRDRLRLLTGGTRDLPARQQGMRDTIGWSFELLAPPEQCLLRQLSVFAGSWSLGAAEAVCGAQEPAGDVLDGLRTLVESSLIMAADDGAEEPRYRMLDTIREYGAERLVAAGEVDAIRRRHSTYYVDLAEQAEPALQDRDQRVWYPRLEREDDNLRAALEWLLEAGEAELALRLAGAVWRFWQRHGDIREGRRWLEEGLAKGGHVPAPIRAKALWGAGWLAYYQGDYARCRELGAEHLAIARAWGDALSTRNALTGLGMAALAEGEHAEAVRALQEALDACLPLGNTWHCATSFLNLGNATMVAGDVARAASLYTEALARYRARGDEVFTARARQHLGFVPLLRGEYIQAGELFAQSLRAFRDLGEQPGIADGLEAVAALCAATGDAGEAGRLIAAAAELRERIGVAPLPYLRAIWQPYIARAEAVLGAAAWSAAGEQGRTLSLREAVASALTPSVR
jgi:predicted ATPase/DNA-binding XRE family transcriptional regulator